MKEGDQLWRPCKYLQPRIHPSLTTSTKDTGAACCLFCCDAISATLVPWSAGEDVPHHHLQAPLHLLAALLPGHQAQGRALLETGRPGPRWPQEEIFIRYVHLQLGCLYSQRSSTTGSEHFAKVRLTPCPR